MAKEFPFVLGTASLHFSASLYVKSTWLSPYTMKMGMMHITSKFDPWKTPMRISHSLLPIFLATGREQGPVWWWSHTMEKTWIPEWLYGTELSCNLYWPTTWVGSKVLVGFLNLKFFSLLFRATVATFGSSQARSWRRAVAVALHHQPQQYQIQATSVTYITAHGNARSLTQWVRAGI